MSECMAESLKEKTRDKGNETHNTLSEKKTETCTPHTIE
jgi:hypothetical protein